MREMTVTVRDLTKRFGRGESGSVLAVDRLSFSVSPGRVTGFLGPNGAGKTTTLRMLLGLVRPTEGTATIGGMPYRDLPDPLRTVGAALEATGFHPGRSARDHLRVLTAAGGLPDRRVEEVLAAVALTESADRRVGGFSLGMRQRLALAAVLLGDPAVLLLDEPANGLDPEGMAWLRGLLRLLAGQGRTVLISSHVLSEVQQTVDDVVIINAGRLVRQASLADLEGPAATLVRTPVPQRLVARLAEAGFTSSVEPFTSSVEPFTSGVEPFTSGVEPFTSGAEPPGPWGVAQPPGPAGAAGPAESPLVRVLGADPATVGALAFGAGVELHELRREVSDLEDVFLQLTGTENGTARAGSGTTPGEAS
jgi:ABC-2 type transport system ATP-binding protein